MNNDIFDTIKSNNQINQPSDSPYLIVCHLMSNERTQDPYCLM